MSDGKGAWRGKQVRRSYSGPWRGCPGDSQSAGQLQLARKALVCRVHVLYALVYSLVVDGMKVSQSSEALILPRSTPRTKTLIKERYAYGFI